MAAPPFNKTKLVNELRIVQSLTGSATNTVLFQANVQDRFYKVEVKWILRNDNDLSVSNAGGRHGTVRGDSTTAVVVSQAAMDTSASSGSTGTFTFNANGQDIRANFSNDGNINGGEIEYIVTVYT